MLRTPINPSFRVSRKPRPRTALHGPLSAKGPISTRSAGRPLLTRVPERQRGVAPPRRAMKSAAPSWGSLHRAGAAPLPRRCLKKAVVQHNKIDRGKAERGQTLSLGISAWSAPLGPGQVRLVIVDRVRGAFKGMKAMARQRSHRLSSSVRSRQRVHLGRGGMYASSGLISRVSWFRRWVFRSMKRRLGRRPPSWRSTQEYEAKMRLGAHVGRQALEIEFLKGDLKTPHTAEKREYIRHAGPRGRLHRRKDAANGECRRFLRHARCPRAAT